LFWPLLPSHTVKLFPSIVLVPTAEPTGWLGPVWLNQIMTACWLTPVVIGVGFSQMW
jgi:hypothetical protein